MAYVVNPDGTVTFIEVKTDRYGNIKPTGNIVEQTTKSSIGYSGYTQPKPKKMHNSEHDHPASRQKIH